MRSLLVLIDGLGDDPIEAWQGRTPFEEAAHPIMDAIAEVGCIGAVSICEDDIVPESCSCILRLLGVAKQDMPANRAYLELLAHNRDVSEFEMVLRCNLAAVDDQGTLVGFNGQGLSPKEMTEAAALCDGILRDIEFIHLSEYRNLLILNKEQKVLDCTVKPPHESVGENIHQLLAELKNQSLSISYFLQESAKRLAPYSKNGIHYELYPWGASARQLLPEFEALHGMTGGAVCKAEIVRGIGKALKLEVVVPPTATGDVDTDVAAKARAAVELLQRHDFVIAHFNGTDEASHRYDYQRKAEMIERIDVQFMAYVAEHYREPLKVLICGDHVTSSVSGKHGEGKVPVIAGVLGRSADEQAMAKMTIDSYHDIIKFLMRK